MKSFRNSRAFFAAILFPVLLAVFVRLFIIDLVRISGPSMENTLENNSLVFVCKVSYGIVRPFSSEFIWKFKSNPRKNDVVVFLQNDKMNVKRVAAVEGDKLVFIENIENSSYYINIDENLIPLEKDQYENLKGFANVPRGKVFVLGDNYGKSVDSRDYGFVSVDNVIGKVLCR